LKELAMNMARLSDLAEIEVAPTAPGDRNLPVGYLRAFVTLLVLAHHSVLAYVSIAPPPQAFDHEPFLWSAFPVVDPHRWAGWTLLVGFDDTFFMALMFFVSGLFVTDSLGRKGAGGFLRDRLARLGVPFVVAAAVLAPLAYYPAYLLSGAKPDLGAYLGTLLSLPYWNSGPAWFLGVLMALTVAVAAIQKLAPGALGGLGRLASGTDRRPGRFFLALSAASAVVYVSAGLAFDPMQWLHLGPFAVQAIRLGHYPLYFFAGVAVGAFGLDRGLLAAAGELARRWKLWTVAAVAAFVALNAVVAAAYAARGQPHALWIVGGGLCFAIACAAACFMLMAVFRRFVDDRNRVWDSLSANAYGMYVVHYAIASWIQFALLPADLPGAAKGLIVAATVIALSWAATACLRRIPGVARIL
jgi:fucose 4-O-acetylase-like acetyltransferase